MPKTKPTTISVSNSVSQRPFCFTGDEIKLQLRMRVTTEQINDHRPEFSNLRVSRTAVPLLQL